MIERGAYALPKGVEISACAPGHYGGTFVLTQATEPKTFNLLVSGDAVSASIQGYLFSGLLTYDPIEESHLPALAVSWEISQNNLQYTFHLRHGVRWSDGEPFDADDVIFTFDAIFDPRYPSRYVGQYTIAGEPLAYEKLDDYTVRFTTPTLYAPFLNDIGFIHILPEHCLRKAFDKGTLQEQWTTQTAIDHPETIVGTGPFVIRSYKAGERLLLTPNPHYWRADKNAQRLPYLDYLIYEFVSDNTTQTLLFTTGQTDAAGIRADDVPWVKRYEGTYNFTLHERGPDTGIFFMWFNLNDGSRPDGQPYLPPHKHAWFADKRFRQALLLATDRQGIVNAVLFGRGEPLNSIISPANRKWHNPGLKTYPYNPEAARALLREAGFTWDKDGHLLGPQGHRVAFELLAYDGSALASGTATTFKENLNAIGIDLTINIIDFSALLNRIDKTFDYDAAMIGFTGGGDPSGGKAIYRSDGHLHLWHPKQEHPATPWEAEIDRLMDLQERTLDETQRIPLIHDMQAIFAEELPLLFMVTPNAYSGIKNCWRNVVIPPTGSILWNLDEIWREPDKQ